MNEEQLSYCCQTQGTSLTLEALADRMSSRPCYRCRRRQLTC